MSSGQNLAPSEAALLARARELGLHLIADHYSEEILIAANVAQKLKANFPQPEDVTVDIWPSMSVREQQ